MYSSQPVLEFQPRSPNILPEMHCVWNFFPLLIKKKKKKPKYLTSKNTQLCSAQYLKFPKKDISLESLHDL